jgi:hypothetical protein
MRLILILISSLGLAGCAALAAGGTSTTTSNAETAASTVSAMPKPSAFDYVGKSNTEVKFVNPAALLTGSSRVDATVIEEQCMFHSADPLFFVPNEKAEGAWTFAGRMNKDATFQALDYQSIFSLGIGEGAQQVGTWPVKMVALSDFPDEYLQDRLSVVSADKIDGADQHALTTRYIANSERLEQRVAQLEQAYDPREECVTRK